LLWKAPQPDRLNILIKTRFLSSVNIAKTSPCVDIGSDHDLVTYDFPFALNSLTTTQERFRSPRVDDFNPLSDMDSDMHLLRNSRNFMLRKKLIFFK